VLITGRSKLSFETLQLVLYEILGDQSKFNNIDFRSSVEQATQSQAVPEMQVKRG
jgi:hypothetical protein